MGIQVMALSSYIHMKYVDSLSVTTKAWNVTPCNTGKETINTVHILFHLKRKLSSKHAGTVYNTIGLHSSPYSISSRWRFS